MQFKNKRLLKKNQVETFRNYLQMDQSTKELQRLATLHPFTGEYFGFMTVSFEYF